MSGRVVKEYFLKNISPQTWLPYFCMIVIGGLLYGKTIGYDYTYLDDQLIIQENFYLLQDLSNLAAIFKRDIFLSLPFENANFYRPVLNVSFMLDAVVSGSSSPVWYHVMNIAYHLLAGGLLYVFLQKLGYRKEMVAVLCLLFLCHPALAQAVAWIPGRNDSLLAIFVLSSFIQLVNLIRTFRIAAVVLHMIFFCLALFTKETAVIMIPLFFIYLFQSLSCQPGIKIKYLLPAGWLMAGSIFFFIRSKVLVNANQGYFDHLFSNILHNSPVILQYLGKLFFPFNLSVLPIIRDTTPIYGFIALVVCVVSALLFMKKTAQPYRILLGATWFLFFLIPPLIIHNPSLPDDLQLEHRLYLPLMGLLLMMAELFNGQQEDRQRWAFLLSGVGVSICFFVLAFIHSGHFKNRFTFWEHAVRTSPHSSLAHLNHGVNYSLLKQHDRALIELQAALSINPVEASAHNEMGVIYLYQNRLEEAEREFLSELRLDPNSYKALSNLSVVYLNRGRYDIALAHLLKTIRLNPRHANTYSNLGFCYMKMQNYPQAETAWKKTIELEPGHLNAYANLINLYAETKRYREAASYAEQYTRLGGTLSERLINEIKSNN